MEKLCQGKSDESVILCCLFQCFEFHSLFWRCCFGDRKGVWSTKTPQFISDGFSFGSSEQRKPGTERVQALADISCLALCRHNNETRAPIANLPNSAQLDGSPFHSPSYIRVHAVVWECGEGQTAVTNIHFALATPHAKCNKGGRWKTQVYLKTGHVTGRCVFRKA